MGTMPANGGRELSSSTKRDAMWDTLEAQLDEITERAATRIAHESRVYQGLPPDVFTAALRGNLARALMVFRSHAPPTAVFFDAQTEERMAGAIREFEAAADRFDPAALRARALEFDTAVFRRRIRDYLDGRWGEFLARRAC